MGSWRETLGHLGAYEASILVVHCVRVAHLVRQVAELQRLQVAALLRPLHGGIRLLR